eukprot:TRINITY_DN4352_c0_g1_i1.p1 TRINITY_DN4352_c0_g1~~TRINITY_DN4352_c0_g1_i1.p1  ORF type:complete len:481 (+),score=137.05 TRINITY_DN4352_c0_g1_i1:59-1444(+)
MTAVQSAGAVVQSLGGMPQMVPQMPEGHIVAQEEVLRSDSLSSGNSSKSSNSKRKRKNKKREKIPPAAPNTFSDCPCVHNNWDNVRVKKGFITLRCRVCQEQWKTETEKVRKCLNFFQSGSCVKGTLCPNPHIHRYKQSLAKRKMIFGQELLLPKQVEMDEMGKEIQEVQPAQEVQQPIQQLMTMAPPPVPAPRKSTPPSFTTDDRHSSQGSGSMRSQGPPPLDVTVASNSFCASSPGEEGVASPFAGSTSLSGPASLFVRNKSTFGNVKQEKQQQHPQEEEKNDDNASSPSIGSERRISIVTENGDVESLEDQEEDEKLDGMTDQEIDDLMERSSGEDKPKYQPTLRREAEERRAASHSRSSSAENLDLFYPQQTMVGVSMVPSAPVSPYSAVFEKSHLRTIVDSSTFGQSNSGSGFCTPTSGPTSPNNASRLSPTHSYAQPMQPTHALQYQPYSSYPVA